MADYPERWAHSDLDGAVEALVAGGVEVTATDVVKGVRRIDFVLDGRECNLIERTPKRHGEWVALDFPWPAAWPDIMLTAAGEPSEAEIADPSPPIGHALCSHDLAGARAVVDAGFAAASVDPPAELSIEEFDGASITTGSRVALNGTTATWLLNLVRLAIAAAPPIDPHDDVIGETFPEWEDSSGQVRGTRTEVLHRLLWLIRMERAEEAEPLKAAQPLRKSLDEWIDKSARLAADRRAGTLDAPAGRENVRDLALRIADALRRASADNADARLVEQLQGVVDQARTWDALDGAINTTKVPSLTGAAAQATPKRSWWRRR